MTATIPYAVAVGNHEDHDNFTPQAYSLKSSFLNLNRFKERFRNPWKESGGLDNCYYSFDYGPLVHFTMLSSQTDCRDYKPDSSQYFWLQKDLASIKTPWMIAGWHKPWYNSNECHYESGDKMKAVLEDFMYGKADIIVAGHTHAYERFHHVYKEKLDPKGPVYVTNGDGGNYEGLCTDWPNLTDLSAFHYSDDYGFTILTLTEATAVWKHYRQSDYTVVDTFTLYK